MLLLFFGLYYDKIYRYSTVSESATTFIALPITVINVKSVYHTEQFSYLIYTGEPNNTK